jgi:hypothetical protein
MPAAEWRPRIFASSLRMALRTSKPPALRALAALRDLRVRVGAVQERVRRGGLVTLACELDELLNAPPGVPADADALLACAVWLLNDGEAHLDALAGVAAERALPDLCALLEDGVAHRALAHGGRLPEVSIPTSARVARHAWVRDFKTRSFDEMREKLRERPDIGVGEYGALLLGACERLSEELRSYQDVPWRDRPGATLTKTTLHHGNVRTQIGQLARHPSAFTIGRLLQDRAVILDDVVGIAARRPTSAAIVRELTSHLGWIARLEVRAAIVQNPFTPLRVAMILSVTCRGRLRHVPAGALHPRLRA